VGFLSEQGNKIVDVVNSLPYRQFQVGERYRIADRGAVLREGEALDSEKLCHLPAGVLVTIEKLEARRALVQSGGSTRGWLSVISAN
ncbi:unnamed protein product, partial [Amoebophrya sp. A25]